MHTLLNGRRSLAVLDTQRRAQSVGVSRDSMTSALSLTRQTNSSCATFTWNLMIEIQRYIHFFPLSFEINFKGRRIDVFSGKRWIQTTVISFSFTSNTPRRRDELQSLSQTKQESSGLCCDILQPEVQFECTWKQKWQNWRWTISHKCTPKISFHSHADNFRNRMLAP